MITYDPKKILKQIAPEAKIKKLLKGNVTLKKTALNFVDAVDFVDRKAVTRVALKTMKAYRDRIKAAEGDKSEVKSDIVKDPRLLIQRVQNEVITQISAEIREQYGDDFAEWGPSDAAEPDPEHQANYGKRFKISEGINGEIPGERNGCRCSMIILSKDTQLDLS